MSSTKILLTGITGFTGARLAEEILATTDWEIYTVERTTPRTNAMGALAYSPRIHRSYHDFRAEVPQRLLDEWAGIEYIFHIGAEVHGFRSLLDPELFIHTNVMGTFHLLEVARKLKVARFIYMSSAEAMGSTPAPQSLDIHATLQPSNPYAAAKAAGEILVNSYTRSFDVANLIIRTMNIFGERQGTDKFIPMVIKKVLAGETITCHVDANGKPGSRQWIYVGDLVKLVLQAVTLAEMPRIFDPAPEMESVFHILGPELDNKQIIDCVGATLKLIPRVEYKEPGPSHDMRYNLKPTLECSFLPTFTALCDTIHWYRSNQEWLCES